VGTIVSWNFYDAKLALGKAFHAKYSQEVERRLGIECELDENGLSRVKNFPVHVAEALSSPSRKIAEVAADQTARAKEEANLKTRATKREIPFEAASRAKAEELGFSAEDARAFLGRVAGPLEAGSEEAARALLRGVIERMPAEFSKAQLYEQAFREGAKARLPFAAIKQATQEMLLNEAEIRHLGRVSGREQYRKAEVPEVANSHTPREVTHEKELREFLGRIIETTPELKLAEFLPEPEEPSPHQNKGGTAPSRPSMGLSRRTPRWGLR
jgi:hypothetical protein